MEQLSHVFKALSEPLRLRILGLLIASSREAYGDELAKALQIPAYQLSRHLKVLKATGLIHERRKGRWVYYSLAKDHGDGPLLGTLRQLLAANGAGAAMQEAAAGRSRRLSQDVGEAPRGDQPKGQAEPMWDTSNLDQGPAVPGVR